MRRAEAGFSLVEMLVTLAITGLLAASLVAALRIMGGAWLRVGTQFSIMAEEQAGLDFLRRSLAQAYPLPAADGLVRFEGTAEQLSYATLLPVHLGLHGYHVIRLHKEGGGLALDILTPDGRPAAPRAWVLEKAQRVRFSFFGVLAETDEARWGDSWTDQPFLPTLIRLDLEGLKGGAAQQIIVRPMIGGGNDAG